jgi:hypothetical protein
MKTTRTRGGPEFPWKGTNKGKVLAVQKFIWKATNKVESAASGWAHLC